MELLDGLSSFVGLKNQTGMLLVDTGLFEGKVLFCSEEYLSTNN